MPIQIFVGTGGVGKTSVAAAAALQASLDGHKSLVLTIDPALRLRTALGMSSSGLEQKVPLDRPEQTGELWAALLNVRQSLDRAVLREAKPNEAKAILEHPLYQVLATSLAGMQELMAIERIHQALGDGFEHIFIDTAPSRHALEFLDKPEFFAHLLSFPIVKLVGRTYNWWIRTQLWRLNRLAVQLYSRVEEILGETLVHQVLEFFSIFRKIAQGYADRAEQTLRLLHDPTITSFTIVTTPFKARRDGEYFWNELTKRNFSVRGMVVNRLWPLLPAELPADSSHQIQELVQWYGAVSGSHQKIWKEVSEVFSGRIPKLILLEELPRDVDGVPALCEIATKLERQW
jgi:anion-transporting  ArsA/GET3 family ATPase